MREHLGGKFFLGEGEAQVYAHISFRRWNLASYSIHVVRCAVHRQGPLQQNFSPHP